jgi:hypothetical protein
VHWHCRATGPLLCCDGTARVLGVVRRERRCPSRLCLRLLLLCSEDLLLLLLVQHGGQLPLLHHALVVLLLLVKGCFPAVCGWTVAGPGSRMSKEMGHRPSTHVLQRQPAQQLTHTTHQGKRRFSGGLGLPDCQPLAKWQLAMKPRHVCACRCDPVPGEAQPDQATRNNGALGLHSARRLGARCVCGGAAIIKGKNKQYTTTHEDTQATHEQHAEPEASRRGNAAVAHGTRIAARHAIPGPTGKNASRHPLS